MKFSKRQLIAAVMKEASTKMATDEIGLEEQLLKRKNAKCN